MNVTDAVESRRSIRAFLPTPVSDDLIHQILTTACRAPSGGNVQPWRIYVLNSDSMQRFRDFISSRKPGAPAYDIYPKNLGEPYRSSRFKVGEDMYALIGIGRDDRAGRLAQFAKNLDFFGAPAAIFCFLDEGMGPPQWSDCGMFLQTFMLLVQEAGLGSCAQEAWAVHQDAVREFTGAPGNLRLFCGVSFGHPDWDHPINRLVSDREPLDVVATFL